MPSAVVFRDSTNLEQVAGRSNACRQRTIHRLVDQGALDRMKREFCQMGFHDPDGRYGRWKADR